MTTELEFKLVDAFALSPFTGNVAGVILRADGLMDRQMLAVASELGASETAFVLEPTDREAAIRLRWFTPGSEVDFCGHATLAAVHALLEAGRFSHGLAEPGTILPIETKTGVLTVRTERNAAPKPAVEQSPVDRSSPPGAGAPAESPERMLPDTIWLDMPHCEPAREPVNVPAVARPLGLDPSALDPALPPIRTQDADVILAVRDLPVLLGLQPQMTELGRTCRRSRIRGVCVTTTNVLSSATAVQSRFFAPAAGIDEDPVTGSVHGPLGLHLVRSGVVPMSGGRADFFCAQARAGGRAGLVRVIVSGSEEDGRKVRIGGRCVTTTGGTLRRPPRT